MDQLFLVPRIRRVLYMGSAETKGEAQTGKVLLDWIVLGPRKLAEVVELQRRTQLVRCHFKCFQQVIIVDGYKFTLSHATSWEINL